MTLHTYFIGNVPKPGPVALALRQIFHIPEKRQEFFINYTTVAELLPILTSNEECVIIRDIKPFSTTDREIQHELQMLRAHAPNATICAFVWPKTEITHSIKEFDFIFLISSEKLILTMIEMLAGVKQKRIPPHLQNLIIEKKEFYNSHLNFLDPRSKERADTIQELEFLHNTFSKHNCKIILDGGCGNGRLAIPLIKKEYVVHGIDISPASIEFIHKEKLPELESKMNKKLSGFFSVASLTKTPFSDSSFEGIYLLWHVICELRTHQFQALAEMFRILAPGGVLVFDFQDVSEDLQIDESGVYIDNTPIGFKFKALIPQIGEILTFLEKCGFSRIEWKRVYWGCNKFVITAVKGSK